MSRGWHRESRAHALAAWGIKSRHTSRPKVRGKKYYYRAMYKPTDTPGQIVPHRTMVERVDKDGNLIVNWIMGHPEFKPDFIETSAFSETPGGAIIGALSDPDGVRPGKLYIYRTTEEPDVDLSHETAGDFLVIDEVRFNRPVDAELIDTFEATPELVAELEGAYGSRLLDDMEIIKHSADEGWKITSKEELEEARESMGEKMEQEGSIGMNELWLERIRDKLNMEAKR